MAAHQRMDPRDRVQHRRMINLCLLCHEGSDRDLIDQIEALPVAQLQVMLGAMTGALTGLSGSFPTPCPAPPRRS